MRSFLWIPWRRTWDIAITAGRAPKGFKIAFYSELGLIHWFTVKSCFHYIVSMLGLDAYVRFVDINKIGNSANESCDSFSKHSLPNQQDHRQFAFLKAWWLMFGCCCWWVGGTSCVIGVFACFSVVARMADCVVLVGFLEGEWQKRLIRNFRFSGFSPLRHCLVYRKSGESKRERAG